MCQDFMSVEGWTRVQSSELQEKTKIYPQQESELTHMITFALSQFFKNKILKGQSNEINFLKYLNINQGIFVMCVSLKLPTN
jgi:hypothetical protein